LNTIVWGFGPAKKKKEVDFNMAGYTHHNGIDTKNLRINGTNVTVGLTATPHVHVANPTGGTTTDAEARTAINAILVALETFGINASS
jgi:hypothetical protein